MTPKNKSQGFRTDGDVIFKTLTKPTTVSTGAGGLVAITSFTSSSVQSIPATEWASFAARYQAFRVKAIRLRFVPNWPAGVPAAGPLGNVNLNPGVAIADQLVSNTPASFAQILSDERSLEFNSFEKSINYDASWSRNPNAKLWNPTSAAIPAANQYQITFATQSATEANVQLFDLFVEWDIEFRGSQ